MSVVEEKTEAKREGGRRDEKERKRYVFPGAGKHLEVVRGQVKRIREIDEEVGSLEQSIREGIEEYRKVSGQKELYDQKDELGPEIKELVSRKKDVFNTLQKTREELRSLSQSIGEEKRKLNMKSTTELENLLKNIEIRIRERPMNTKEEMEISTEKNRITKLLGMQGMFKEKDGMVKELEKRKRREEEELSLLKMELDKKNERFGEIIKKIEKNRKTEYPAPIKRLMEKKGKLREERDGLRTQKKAEFEAMDHKASVYSDKLVLIEGARKQKEAVTSQERVIKDLEEKKGKLEESLEKDPEMQLMALKAQLQGYKHPQTVRGAQVSLPFPVAAALVSNKIAIPRDNSGIDSSIKAIDLLIEKEREGFEERKKKIARSLGKIDKEIEKQREVYGKMDRPEFPSMEEF